MNYKTCTLEELTAHIEYSIQWAKNNLADSPKSRAEMVFEAIGWFLGTCAVHAFDYDYEMVEKWREIAR